MPPNNSEFLYPSLSSSQSNNSILKSSVTEETSASSSTDAADASTSSPSSTIDWPLAKTPKFSTHRGRKGNNNNSSTQQNSDETGTNTSRERTRLKDVFSCAKPIRGYSPPSSSSSEEESSSNGGGVMNAAAENLQIKNNMEALLDGLVNGFWQCNSQATTMMQCDQATVQSNISRATPTCKEALDALAQSTETMHFQFVPMSPSSSNNNNTRSHHDVTMPHIPSSPNNPQKSHQQQPKKAVGKMFKRIRVKRGENIGLELFEYGTSSNSSIYISKVAKEGTGLKRGMRIIAINDHPCPDSVGEAIELLGKTQDDYDNGYVTFVTGEEHDFETAASVVGEEDSQSDIRSSTGYV